MTRAPVVAIITASFESGEGVWEYVCEQTTSRKINVFAVAGEIAG